MPVSSCPSNGAGPAVGGASGAHVTVLLRETVEWLAPRRGGRYLDGTLGLGGHSEGILRAADGEAEVLGLDRDRQAMSLAEERLKPFGGRVHLDNTSFSGFEAALDRLGWDRVDGAVLDLGVSSLQLDTPERGFSFLADGPLDMRMDQGSGFKPARVLVNKAGFEELRRIIGEYGEEPMAGRIARAIVREREREEIDSTARLAEIVSRAYPPDRRRQARNHPATKTFQALRLAVNRELDELGEFLERIPERLAPGARVAVISFHSLEDRMVKLAFRGHEKGCVCPPRQPLCTCGRKPTMKILTKKPVTPEQREMDVNPRSRSAKLRVAERLPLEGGRP
ncbi:16S rRNA (cytosine(1402)-N(4))-methyltransferase RsmH [Desulfovibrio aminophilus]|nr:16S rRNA (cytosine(1402)-N(4))-methyltransferase RsmH [Desulfovibrio aminophilus]